MLVDAHCHLLGSSSRGENPDEVLDRARQAGVGGFVVVGTDLEDSRAGVVLARRRPDACACVGLHPHEARTWSEDLEAELEALAGEPEVRFLGETGLDWHYDLSPREDQATAFRAQIRLARRLGKPLMIHTREAREETLRILDEEGAAQGVFHCFSEDAAFARQVLDRGFYLSLSGILTFPKAEALREVARMAPLDRILVETDSPYLAPVPHRGRPNQPAYVVHVAEAVSRLRGISLEALAARTTRNLEDLCGWSPAS
jgi:TatD DNase family protein